MFRKIVIAGSVSGLLLALVVVILLNEVRLARGQTALLVETSFQRHGRQVSHVNLAPHRIAALIMVEDPAFRHHHGVDLDTPGAGLTTISQGLVKLLYFPQGFRPGLQKIKQSLIACHAFDALVPKDRQLDLYLNMTYFGTVDGRPIHGVSAAARTYYGKSHPELSDDEFLALIGMTIAPNDLKPGTPASRSRVARIKKYLAGEIMPRSVVDVDYTGRTATLAETAMMFLLRLICRS